MHPGKHNRKSELYRLIVETLARSRRDLGLLEEEETAEEASDAGQKGFRDKQLVETFKTTLKF